MVYSLAAIISFTSVSLILKSEVTPFSATNIYSNILKREHYRLQLLWLFQYKMIHSVQSGFQRANSGNLDRLTYIRGVDYTPKAPSYVVISCFGESMSKSSYNNQYQQVLTQGTCLGVGLRAFKCILGLEISLELSSSWCNSRHSTEIYIQQTCPRSNPYSSLGNR